MSTTISGCWRVQGDLAVSRTRTPTLYNHNFLLTPILSKLQPHLLQAAGGHVIFAGCWRVQGDLAVSRAFGDCHLKRFGVSAEPELSMYEIKTSDAFLVLASDGLWDVIDEAQVEY